MSAPDITLQDITLLADLFVSVYVSYLAFKNYKHYRHWPDLLALLIGSAYVISFSYLAVSDVPDVGAYGSTIMRTINFFTLSLIAIFLNFRNGWKKK